MKKDLISLARQQIFDEYIKQRQQDFDRWMRDADSAWKEKRVKLPYPAFSVYPDEEEIYNRIEQLHKQVQGEINAQEKDQTENLVGNSTEEIQEQIKTPIEKVKQVTETKLPILLQKRKDIL